MSEEEKNTEKEQAISNEQPAKDEANSSAEPIAETEKQETNNEKPETETMEVHHHTHHTHHGHEKKNWKSYFWEFLMLFLAVFCGFLAEYQLEHVIERNREKKFAKQMLADLRADSLYFSKRITLVNALLQKHQQFYDLMTNRLKPSDKEILNKCLPLLYTLDIQVTTATYNQMKTSGGLRYIQDQELTSALQQYYEVLLPRAVKNSDLVISYFMDNINPFIIKHFRVQDYDFVGDSVKVISLLLWIEQDKQTRSF